MSKKTDYEESTSLQGQELLKKENVFENDVKAPHCDICNCVSTDGCYCSCC